MSINNLFAFCQNIVVEGNHDIEEIAELLMLKVETGSSWDQKWAWDLLREAGSPLIHRQGFLDAARLAIELVQETDPNPPKRKRVA
jgi:hypothetical protein